MTIYHTCVPCAMCRVPCDMCTLDTPCPECMFAVHGITTSITNNTGVRYCCHEAKGRAVSEIRHAVTSCLHQAALIRSHRLGRAPFPSTRQITETPCTADVLLQRYHPPTGADLRSVAPSLTLTWRRVRWTMRLVELRRL